MTSTKCSDTSKIAGLRDVSGSYVTHSSLLSVSEAARSQYRAGRGPRIQCEVLQGPQCCPPPMRMGLGSPGRALWKRRRARGCQTLLWSCSVGLSEAEDWLGREASRAPEDTDGDLYRK